MIVLLWLACPAAHDPLDGASSPYLRQHADDLVAWRPWSDEAFARARELDRPVLLAIGYATCHWCHVMAEESWRDPAIAALVNERFVAVLVDREERPDVDDVHLRVATALGAEAAWPLTLVLTPDGDPVLAANYLPPRDGDRGVRKGLASVLTEVSARWSADRDALLADAADRSRQVRELARPAPPGRVPGPEVTLVAAERTRAAYDPVHHGFGRAPKFPQPTRIEGHLAHAVRSADAAAREQALATLRAVAGSALADPLSGGFHRYATDEAWRVPHYEKMTGENAVLAGAYVSGWQATGDPLFADVALRTLGWLDTMRRPDGAYASALDADSAGADGRLAEGAYYTWTRAEVGDDGLADALAIGDEPTAPRLVAPADPAGLDRLRATRERRPAPLRDDKAVAAVQGLVIGANARVGFVLERPDRVAVASALATLVLDRMRGPDGRLRRTLADDAPIGVLEDQVLVAEGLLDLFEATAEPRWLAEAVALMDLAEARFADPVGGWFRTPDDGEELLLRPRPDRDLPEPSGASVAAQVLLRLAALTGDDRWEERADRALGSYADALRRRPTSLPVMVEALARRHRPPPEVVVAWPEGADPDALLDVVRGTYVPGRVLVAAPEERLRALADGVPLVRDKDPAGVPTAWVCRGGVCRAPSTDADALREALRVVTLPQEAP